MITIFKQVLLAVVVTSITLFLSSCTPGDDVTDSNQVPEEVLAQIGELGLDTEEVKVISPTNPITGERTPVAYQVEGDLLITPETLAEMVRGEIDHEAPMEEQYSTNNLVQGEPRTISVIGYTGGSFALDGTMQTALQWAINNYNALGLELSFSLDYGTNYQAYDIVVYKVSGGGGGSAGFPSGGDPYQFVQIQSGTSSYGTNVTEHVITHEIGHCLGLRHTDYFNRSLSCGSGGNEGSSGVGANHIPGTPTGTDTNSIMQACFSSSEDGEFGSFDITALQYLY